MNKKKIAETLEIELRTLYNWEKTRPKLYEFIIKAFENKNIEYNWQNIKDEKAIKDIINDLSGYPLQVLDFMLDWFYRDLEKFPLIVLVNEDVFDMKPCVCFNLSNTYFIWESLCIKASDFYSALFTLQEYDLISYYQKNACDSYCFCKMYFNLEKIISLLVPAQTKDSKIFVDILKKYIEVCNELKIKKLVDYPGKSIFKAFPSVEYYEENPIGYQSYDI